MKTINYRKFTAVCLIVYALVVCANSIEAQRKTVVKNLRKSYKSQIIRKKIAKKRKRSAVQTVSGGVVNGKAKNLIKPEYPKLARAVGAYGTVSVFVLIDVDGKVVKAKATDGHPFLRPVSIKAAIESKFEPVILSGNPVKVQGVIVYNFIPPQWNWLEVGYTLGYGSSNYYSIKTLIETLSYGYEEERQLLNQWSAAGENQDKIIETVIASIQNKLNNEAKKFWLLELGLTLARYKREPRINKETSNENSPSFQNLQQLVQNPPADANEELLERMKRFIVLIDEGDISKIQFTVQKLEESFPYVGR